MAVTLNHTIIQSHDKTASAAFLTELLDLPPPTTFGPFRVVQVGDTSLDFVESDGEIASRHFAFMVSEDEFDTIFGKIKGRGMAHWADPHREKPDKINTRDGGRGVYFEDPNGHMLEILTRPYGSGGWRA